MKRGSTRSKGRRMVALGHHGERVRCRYPCKLFENCVQTTTAFFRTAPQSLRREIALVLASAQNIHGNFCRKKLLPPTKSLNQTPRILPINQLLPRPPLLTPQRLCTLPRSIESTSLELARLARIVAVRVHERRIYVFAAARVAGSAGLALCLSLHWWLLVGYRRRVGG